MKCAINCLILVRKIFSGYKSEGWLWKIIIFQDKAADFNTASSVGMKNNFYARIVDEVYEVWIKDLGNSMFVNL